MTRLERERKARETATMHGKLGAWYWKRVYELAKQEAKK